MSNNVRLSVALDTSPSEEGPVPFVRLHNETNEGEGLCWLEMHDAIALRDELSEAIAKSGYVTADRGDDPPAEYLDKLAKLLNSAPWRGPAEDDDDLDVRSDDAGPADNPMRIEARAKALYVYHLGARLP